MADFLDLAQQAYEASSAFLDANHRSDIDYSLKAFRNEHAAGSKYLSAEYASRSRLFRPKTRSVIRKNEAAGAVALFSNMDVVNITPGNPDDVMSVASAEALKEILEYRLSRTIPAFPLVMGALQDAQTVGMVCSYQYWEFEKRGGRVIKDKPCIDLRPIENIRIDGGANWLDPVGTSPYFCDIIPMYVCQVRGMMNNKDEKTNAPQWKKYEDSVILRARPDVMDSTRKARLGKQQDPYDETTGIKDFDIVWVMRWFMRDSLNDDYAYYTLGTEELLTDAKPLEEVYFHGKRPYVMGYSILETHRVMKTSMPILVRSLQQETNEIANQRIDNVKFVLNKRWMVARGRQVDVNSLVRNVPGGVTLVTDPKTDVQESNWPDVTSSAYVEQDRLNADFDDVAGNFSPNTKFANKGTNDTLGGTRMAAQGAGMMTDYLLRTFIETWYEPMLRQLVLLEQYYETDELVLSVCANKARLFPRFGLSRITDDLLMNEVNVCVNVGMGSSNPNERFQKFVITAQTARQLVLNAPPGFNVKEELKELYSNAGFRDGERFFPGKEDPRLVQAMQMVQQLQQQLNGKQMELQSTAEVERQKLLSNERVKGAEIRVNAARIDGDLAVKRAELDLKRLEILKDSTPDLAEEIDAPIDAAIEKVQSLIAMHAVKINGALEVDKAKREAKAEVSDAKAKTAQAETQTKMAETTATRIEASNKQLMDGVNQILQGIAALGAQKKRITLLKKDGVTVGAEIGAS
jgi:flagellin-like hook-associated protein FlgL